MKKYLLIHCTIILFFFISIIPAQSQVVDFPDEAIFHSLCGNPPPPPNGQPIDPVVSENSVFISRSNANIVLNANNSAEWNCSSSMVSSLLGIGFAVSNNGGNTWAPKALTIHSTSFSDPAACIAPNGNLFVLFDDNNDGQTIARSTNGGLNWSAINVIGNQCPPPPSPNQDKGHLWIDNSFNPNDPFGGRLYAAWTNFCPSNFREIEFKRSSNNGTTWTGHLTLSSNSALHNLGVNLKSGPNGEVYAAWSAYTNNLPSNETQLIFAKSLNGGVSFSSAQVIQSINGHTNTPLGGGKNMRHFSWPSMTVNQQNGEIYLVWTDLTTPTNPDIYLISSPDAGITWTPKVRVNQVGTNDQWSPWIACDDASGALVVIYYDTRTNMNQVHTFVAISYDRGVTWTDYKISDAFWDGDGIPGQANYAGDYIAIDVFKGKAVPVWSDKRLSTGQMLAYTQPFEIPCPIDLTLCSPAYTIWGEASYKVQNNITVGGTGCSYVIKNTSPGTIMQAGNEIVIGDGFECEGEFYAYIDPNCTSFSDRTGDFEPEGESNDIFPVQEKKSSVPNVYVYPNPSSGQFTLLTPSGLPAQNSELSIIDMLGNIVHSQNISPEPQTVNFDLSSNTKGIYFIKLTSGDTFYTEKIIIQ